MNKDEAIDIIILHMVLPENKGKEFSFYQLLNLLCIPTDIQEQVFQTMSIGRDFITGPPTIREPIVHITPKGFQYAEELKEKYFLKHGKPLNPSNQTIMSLDETCELLFQMHKNGSYMIYWTKSTHDNKPANLSVAKELLERRGVIYSKGRYTHLSPEYYEVSSCKDALKIAAEKETPQPNLINNYNINTYGANSPASGRDTNFTQTTNTESTKKAWYHKWVDEFVKNSVQYLVTAAFTFGIGLTTGKSCNQSNNKSQPQSTSPQKRQNSPDSIKQFRKDR